MEQRRKIYSVSSVNRYIKQLFMDDYALNRIFVKGEVGSCKYHSSGHIYFTLKDSGSAIKAVMFAGDRKAGLSFRLAEGMEVIVYGSVAVYERNGEYQLYAKQIVTDGAGALYAQFEKLKKKLEEEGLFDPRHKKPIPKFPKKLGVVTAGTGAAVHDIISVSTRRNPYIQIVFRAAAVQGEGAAQSVAAGIRELDEYGVDVIIAGRGGGSLEDLWAFNEEAVARAIYECRTPIISAVGHETDFTIADFAADLRAPTPSAAAELAVPDIMAVLDRLDSARSALDLHMGRALSGSREKLAGYQAVLKAKSPRSLLEHKRQLLSGDRDKLELLMTHRLNDSRRYAVDLAERLGILMDMNLTRTKGKMSLCVQKLEGLSPMRQLERGYAYVTDVNGHAVTSVSEAEPGEKINIAVTDGKLEAEIISSVPAV